MGFGQQYEAICFIPEAGEEIRVFAVGLGAALVRATRLACNPLPRWWAGLLLLIRNPLSLLGLLAAPLPRRPSQLRKRARQILAISASQFYSIQQDYVAWMALFDCWDRDDFTTPDRGIAIGYLVFAQDPASEALKATIRSLEAQYDKTAYLVLAEPVSAEKLIAGIQENDSEYVGILQAGEILPRHATRMSAAQLERIGRPDIAIVDEDEVTLAEERQSPFFKPTPNYILMLSGTMSRGLWLVRRDLLLAGREVETSSAEALRLELWLNRHSMGLRGFSQRIPFILCHRRPDTEAAPPEVLARIVERHLDQGKLPLNAKATYPITFRLKHDQPDESVTVIVPSTLRKIHSLECISSILKGTKYTNFELHVAVSQKGPLDSGQQRMAREILAIPNARVTALEAPSFNFSWVNNQIIRQTQSEYVLLLNDDVSAIRPDWLHWMAAYLRDPTVGIVGARLLYPNKLVQHGGVIMGLAGLCDHAHRYLPSANPGYMSRAVLAQELSAVTAACMLVRRCALERVGGLDESYPSAFNDVDLALRVGELGYAVVYAPQAELCHHELLTYGSHYAGDRQAFHDVEVARMQSRWAKACKADPFHNPNLRLEPGFEWKPAFPPRVDFAG